MRSADLVWPVVAATLAAGGAAAQDPGNAQAGRELARAWCAECHQVEVARAEVSVLRPPSFFSIARRSEVTPVWLHAFFQTPHPVMPNIALTPAQRDDLIAHILSFKAP